MAAKKKETAAPEPVLEEQAEDLLPEEDDELRNFACYRVSWPGGVSLREGPGQAYRHKTVLPFGATVLGEDVEDLLRENRNKDDAAWLRVHSAKEGFGWMDSIYLERVDAPAE